MVLFLSACALCANSSVPLKNASLRYWTPCDTTRLKIIDQCTTCDTSTKYYSDFASACSCQSTCTFGDVTCTPTCSRSIALACSRTSSNRNGNEIERCWVDASVLWIAYKLGIDAESCNSRCETTKSYLPSMTEPQSGSASGTIVGAVVGSIGGIVVVVIVVFLVLRIVRRRSSQKDSLAREENTSPGKVQA
jgi:hypothetical protein